MLNACSPDADQMAPTETIVITNIPKMIKNTASEAFVKDNPTHDNTGEKATYKVHVLISEGITGDDTSVGVGDVIIEDTTGDRVTATIRLYKPRDVKDESHKPDLSKPYSGTNWSAIAVVISPEYVKDIFDIDCKVSFGGPTDSSVVSYNWADDLQSKKFMDLQKGVDGIDNFKRLYGKIGWSDGVVVTDDDIKKVPCDPCICIDDTCDCANGDPCDECKRPPRAGENINSFTQFTIVNNK